MFLTEMQPLIPDGPNLEHLNAPWFKEGLEPAERLTRLNGYVIEQMEILTQAQSRRRMGKVSW